jgi:hypothetical protein
MKKCIFMASPSASYRRLRVVPPWRDRRISATIPLAAELKNKKAPTIDQIAGKPYQGNFQPIFIMVYWTTVIRYSLLFLLLQRKKLHIGGAFSLLKTTLM